jgi:glucose-6-phosphate 1-epimerase
MLDLLNEKFRIDQTLHFELHPSGLVRGVVTSDACQASFFLHGAHVAEFQPRGEQPVLFMSEASYFQPGKPIRGGVPICFPWFGPHKTDPAAPSHGWARTAAWDVTQTNLENGVLSVTLRLCIESFELEYNISFGRKLDLRMQIANRDSAPQSCELALHTYFYLSDIDRVSIQGLELLPYLDQLTGQTVAASGAAIEFVAETDRIYQGACQQIVIRDQGWGRKIKVSPRGSQSTVVWNPWVDKSKRMPDFGDLEYQRMCCVETANVTGQAVRLAAGGSATTAVTIEIEALPAA